MSSFELDCLEEDEEIELSLELEEEGIVTDEDLGRIHIAVTLTSMYQSPLATEVRISRLLFYCDLLKQNSKTSLKTK